MTKIALFAALFTVPAIAGAAAVGSISSAEPFTLSGATINPAGVPSWPVSLGDEIATGGSDAIVTFQDGSRVALARNSRVTVEKAGSAACVRLQAGALRYSLDPKSSAAVAALTLKSIPSSYREGWISVSGNDAYFAATSSPAAVSSSGFEPATSVRVTPFNLGYVNALRHQPPAGRPPVPPPGQGGTPPERPPAISNHRP